MAHGRAAFFFFFFFFFFFLCNSIDWPIKMQSYLEVCNVILIKNNKKQLCCKEKVADITIDVHCIRMRKSRRGPKFQECGNLQMKGINIYFIRSLFVFDSLSNKSEFKYAHSLMTNRMRNCWCVFIFDCLWFLFKLRMYLIF